MTGKIFRFPIYLNFLLLYKVLVHCYKYNTAIRRINSKNLSGSPYSCCIFLPYRVYVF